MRTSNAPLKVLNGSTSVDRKWDETINFGLIREHQVALQPPISTPGNLPVPKVMAKSTHEVDPLTSDVSSGHGSETGPPHAHRLTGYADAALKQEIQEVPQRQRKTDIHQHDKADRLRRRVGTAKWAGWQCARSSARPPPLPSANMSCHVNLTTPLSPLPIDTGIPHGLTGNANY